MGLEGKSWICLSERQRAQLFWLLRRLLVKSPFGAFALSLCCHPVWSFSAISFQDTHFPEVSELWFPGLVLWQSRPNAFCPLGVLKISGLLLAAFLIFVLVFPFHSFSNYIFPHFNGPLDGREVSCTWFTSLKLSPGPLLPPSHSLDYLLRRFPTVKHSGQFSWQPGLDDPRSSL